MAVHFNHTILSARDSKASAKFLTEILNLPAPKHWGPFEMVVTENGAYLDYMNTVEIAPQHYAFLVNEAEFDEIEVVRVQGGPGLPEMARDGRATDEATEHLVDVRGAPGDAQGGGIGFLPHARGQALEVMREGRLRADEEQIAIMGLPDLHLRKHVGERGQDGGYGLPVDGVRLQPLQEDTVRRQPMGRG